MLRTDALSDPALPERITKSIYFHPTVNIDQALVDHLKTMRNGLNVLRRCSDNKNLVIAGFPEGKENKVFRKIKVRFASCEDEGKAYHAFFINQDQAVTSLSELMHNAGRLLLNFVNEAPPADEMLDEFALRSVLSKIQRYSLFHHDETNTQQIRALICNKLEPLKLNANVHNIVPFGKGIYVLMTSQRCALIAANQLNAINDLSIIFDPKFEIMSLVQVKTGIRDSLKNKRLFFAAPDLLAYEKSWQELTTAIAILHKISDNEAITSHDYAALEQSDHVAIQSLMAKFSNDIACYLTAQQKYGNFN